MPGLIQPKYIRKYVNSGFGDQWPVSSLFAEPLPVLALRNLNDFDDHYTDRDWHSTFSWTNKAKIRDAIDIAIPRLRGYGALKSNTKGGQGRLKRALNHRLPAILQRFQRQARKMKLRRLSNIEPSQRQYRNFLVTVANVVGEVCKVKQVDTPMFGSKVMHFLMPEIFPIWDTAVIYKKALKNEMIPSLPDGTDDNIPTAAGRSYVRYLHLLITEFSGASIRRREQVLSSCIQQCAKELDVSAKQMREVLEFHYDDLWATVLEICLIGKHCDHRS